jgi:hypothetical protein
MQNEVETELSNSTDALRLAAQMFTTLKQPELARYLSDQADKNLSYLQVWAPR